MTWAVQTRNTAGWATQQVIGGTLEADAARFPRTSLTVTIVPQKNVPLEQTPYGTRIRATWDGAPMFNGSVERSSITRPDGVLELEAWDTTTRMRFVKKPEEKQNLIANAPASATVAEAVTAIYQHYGVPVPSITGGTFGDIDLSDFDTAGMLGWEAVEEITDSEGAEAFADAAGGLRIRRNPDLGDVDKGVRFGVGENGTMTAYTLDMDRRTNEVLVTVSYKDAAQESGTGYRVGVWRDTGPLTGVATVGAITSTRTVRKGPSWKDKPQADLDAIAANMSKRLRGYARSVVITALPRIVAPGDTVRVAFLNGRSERYLVRAVRMDLTGAPMTVSAVNPNPGSL